MKTDFTRFTDTKCPINPFLWIVYRTAYCDKKGDRIISHIHMAKQAGDLNWSGSPAFGKIYDYKQVELSDKLMTSVQFPYGKKE